MVAFNKFEAFSEHLSEGVHQFQAAGHTLRIYLSNTTPDAALDAVKADLAEISAANGYTAGGEDVQNDTSRTAGTTSVTGVDVTWTATGGSFGPFRYIVLYNDTPTSPVDPLIGWWDYGSAISVNATETFTTDFGTSLFTVA